MGDLLEKDISDVTEKSYSHQFAVFDSVIVSLKETLCINL